VNGRLSRVRARTHVVVGDAWLVRLPATGSRYWRVRPLCAFDTDRPATSSPRRAGNSDKRDTANRHLSKSLGGTESVLGDHSILRHDAICRLRPRIRSFQMTIGGRSRQFPLLARLQSPHRRSSGTSGCEPSEGAAAFVQSSSIGQGRHGWVTLSRKPWRKTSITPHSANRSPSSHRIRKRKSRT